MYHNSLASKCGGYHKKRRLGKKITMHGFATIKHKARKAGGQMPVHAHAGQASVSAY
jgi:hypothetical protein